MIDTETKGMQFHQYLQIREIVSLPYWYKLQKEKLCFEPRGAYHYFLHLESQLYCKRWKAAILRQLL